MPSFRVALVNALVTALLVACQTTVSSGGSCGRDGECTGGLVCALGRCRAACRESRDCAPGERCLVEPATGLSACSIDGVDGCEASGCPEGLACRDRICVNLCGAIVRCPDGVCVGDVCMSIQRDAGPAPIDADVDGGPVCHGPHCDPVVALALNGAHVLVVAASGEVWAWGDATGGLLGDRTEAHGSCASCSPSPVRALGPDARPWTDAIGLTVGGNATCILRRDTTVWCWGANWGNQLGNGTGPGSDLPVNVLLTGGAPLDGVVALEGDNNQTCAIRGAAREVWCWGSGGDGELGDGMTGTPPMAVRATELGTNIVAVHTSYRHTLTLDAMGVLRGVGFDNCSVLGTDRSAPVLHAVTLPVTNVLDFATSVFDTCALGRDGTLRCWGLAAGATGHATGFPACAPCATGADSCTPTPQPILQPRGHLFVRIFGHSGGTYFGIDAGGGLWAWGGAFDEPIRGRLDPFQLIAAGVAEAYSSRAACVRTVAGDVLCFGANDQGQLGRGTMSASELDIASVVWP